MTCSCCQTARMRCGGIAIGELDLAGLSGVVLAGE
jgi:hypothetical protein